MDNEPTPSIVRSEMPLSFTSGTSEVVKMTEAMKEGWPGFWYELLQGAIDWNNWESGFPSIKVYYANNEEPVEYGAFLADRERGIKHPVMKVDVVNHIDPVLGGMGPKNLFQLEHEDRGDDHSTMGVHGRGMKVAAVAGLSSGNAKRIIFSSYVDRMGAWTAEAIMKQPKADPDASEMLFLEIESDLSQKCDTTTISVHEPNESLVEQLAELPEWFLPSDPTYPFYRLGEVKVGSRNVFTALVGGESANDYPRINPFRLYEDYPNNPLDLEALRVEILDIPEPDESINTIFNTIYIDGLRVDVPGAKFAFPYSIWRNKRLARYTCDRSRDSRQLQGSPDQHIEFMLGVCDQPQVFEHLLTRIFQEGDALREAQLRLYGTYFEEKARDAMVAGLNGFLANHGINPEGLHLADSDYEQEQAIEACLNSIQLPRNWVRLIHELVPDVGLAETTLAHMRIQAEREARQARAEAEQAQSELEKTRRRDEGIITSLSESGEVVRINEHFSPEEYLRSARVNLLGAMAMQHGRLKVEPGKMTFNGDTMPLGAEPVAVAELGSHWRDILSHIAYALPNAQITLKYSDGNSIGVMFSAYSTRNQNALVMVSRGELDPRVVKQGMELSITFDNGDSGTPEQSFFNSVQSSYQEMIGEDGYLDRNKFIEVYGDRFPALLTIERAQRALEETQELLDRYNAVRSEVGLAPVGKGLHTSVPGRSIRLSGKGTTLFEFFGGEISEVHERQSVQPDVEIIGPSIGKITPHLVEVCSSIPQEKYQIASLPFERRTSGLRLRINKPLEAGLQSIMCPLGYEPKAIYVEGALPEYTYARVPGAQYHVISFASKVPAGLTISYEKMRQADSSLPTEHETQELADFSLLDEHWQTLVQSIRDDSTLSTKNKLDILLTAWTRAFNYRNDQFTFDTYKQERELGNITTLNSKIINLGSGNCGYAESGFQGLASLCGIPIRAVFGFLMSHGGKVSLDKSSHAFNQAYLAEEQRWVWIEPQTGYIEATDSFGNIPDKYKQLILNVPEKSAPNPLWASLDFTISEAFEALPLSLAQIWHKVAHHEFRPRMRYARGNTISSKRQMVKRTAGITAAGVVGGLAIAGITRMIADYIPNAAQIEPNAAVSLVRDAIAGIRSVPANVEVTEQLHQIDWKSISQIVLQFGLGFYAHALINRIRSRDNE